jgi:hypothetical protein
MHQRDGKVALESVLESGEVAEDIVVESFDRISSYQLSQNRITILTLFTEMNDIFP